MRIAKILLFSTIVFLASCDSNNEEVERQVEVPTTYTFERNGASTVSFSGQTERLNMLSEIKTYIRKGDAGEWVEASKLNDFFANQNAPFTDASLNESAKQLEDKTFLADVSFFKELFERAEAASADVVANGTVASEGVAGRLERGTSGNFILVDEKGWEFTQLVEKGLMGAVFFHQIYNVYLTDSRIGPSVDNENLVEGTNYTAKEHHFDEAFGYWGVPVDFPAQLTSADNRFWANYSYSREALLGSVTKLKDAFLTGRTAIVNNDQQLLDAQVDVLYKELELVAAATAIHYINSALSDDNQGDFLHHVSEAYAFAMALKYSPYKSISDAQLNTILNSNFGTDGNFWSIGDGDLEAAKATLVTVYPELEEIKDIL